MRGKVALAIGLLSVGMAIAFSVQWFRNQNQIYRLVIATGSREGEYFAFATALSQVVQRHRPDIQITVQESQGSIDNVARLEQGQAQLAIVQSDTAPNPRVQAIAFLFPEVFHLVARSDSGIQRVSDLAGKRIALMPEGSGSFQLFQALSHHYGLDKVGLNTQPLSPADAYVALQQGQVDALFRVMAIGNPSMRELLQTSRSRLIAIDQVDSMKLSLPFLEASIIPKGTYDGLAPVPGEDLRVAGVRAVLVADESVDPDVAKAITQTLFDFRSELVAKYPRAATMRLPDAGENLGLPLHLGARAYYEKTQPDFLSQNADVLGLLFSIGTLLLSGLWQLRSRLTDKQKDRADRYNGQILQLVECIPNLTTLEDLQTVRRQLFTILSKVVVDLDQDRITPESFQCFTFPWEIAITALRHREMILLNGRSQPESSEKVLLERRME